MTPPEEKSEISNEFFKRLNQQIVQKDNLIKLLQLQIKNLKSQVEEGAAGDDEKKGDLQKTLAAKESEIGNLQSELESEKGKLAAFEKEKDEQIRSLNQKVLESQSAPPGAEAKLAEFEATIARLEQEVQAGEAARLELQGTLDSLKNQPPAAPETTGAPPEEIARLTSETARLEAELAKQGKSLTDLEQQNAEFRAKIEQADQDAQGHDTELASLRRKIEQADNDLTARTAELTTIREQSDSQVKAANEAGTSRIAELEQDVLTLKTLLAEKDEQLPNTAIQTGPDPKLLAELDVLKKQAKRAGELEKLVSALEAEVAGVPVLKAKLNSLESQSTALGEAAMKLTALESEREQLLAKLKDREDRSGSATAQFDAASLRVSELTKRLEQKENELGELRASLEATGEKSRDEQTVHAEVEQLTNQVADQLLAIQKFEGLLRKSQEQLAGKDEKISILTNKVATLGDAGRPIPISSDSEIISSFIDFFDGLDTYLSKNPIPELQSLHKKLLDRLIIPNEIHYVPVISEEFDETKHIATDYFRSAKFPEKCIVFELEKGYRKGPMVIKKSKVWVVQNLFTCKTCQTLQSSPDSRFCNMCGQKIVAPNNLPIESLPWFEPTPTTYLRFAERMIEKEMIGDAKNYLMEGLKIDPDFIPLMVRLAEVHSIQSEFPEAISLLQRAITLKPDPRISDQVKALEVRNTIYQQARALNLPQGEFDKLISLLQTKVPTP